MNTMQALCDKYADILLMTLSDSRPKMQLIRVSKIRSDHLCLGHVMMMTTHTFDQYQILNFHTHTHAQTNEKEMTWVSLTSFLSIKLIVITLITLH